MNKKLYRITLRGTITSSSGIAYGRPYVVAETLTEAIEKVQNYLYGKGMGFPTDRELDTIELLAEESDYPACKIQLFL